MSVESSPIIKEFLIESFEGLSLVNEELTQFERNLDDKELLNSIYRRVHTIKGSASFLGFKVLESITHAAENILDSIREKSIKMDSKIVDILLESFDTSIEILKSIEEFGKEAEESYSELIEKLVFTFENKSLPEEKPLEEERKISDEKTVLKSSEQTSVDEKIEVKQLTLSSGDGKIEAAKKSTSKQEINEVSNNENKVSQSNKVLKDTTVRVNVQLLDKIMNIVGELVLNRNQILQYANSMDSHALTRLAQQLNVITTELQTDIMTTRMQPVGSVISKFERVVRDLAKSQGKKITLTITGKDTELDKTLLDAIKDPLTHLIRNSVDHGIENPEIRLKNGKPEEGHIRIKAYHEGGQVTIEIVDDGNGIDPDKILTKAIEKGIYTEAQASKLTEKQILNLIFNPGFSTKEEVTNLSGRGVGMDVVKSNIEAVGGSVDLSSKLGDGTTFKLKIPLTLAIVPALVVESSNETFAIPQVNLVELVRLEGNDVDEAIEQIHGSEFFRLRGDLIPIFRLNESLDIMGLDKAINYVWEKQLNQEKDNLKDVRIEEQTKNNNDELYSNNELNSESLSDSVNIVILNADDKLYGLIVDFVLDTEEIVVKPLSITFKDLNYYAGATIMGDGRLALILDALGFYNSLNKDDKSKEEADMLAFEDDVTAYEGEKQEILLSILGDGRTYGIPLILVSRLEEFSLENVEYSGNQPLIRYGEAPMPLINLEETLGLDGKSSLIEMDDKVNKAISCVVVKFRDRLFGFVVKEIHDIAISLEKINEDTIDRDGLLGTVFVNKKTITLLDVHSILENQKISTNLNNKKMVVNKKNGIVLLVEDSPLYRKIETDFLNEQGFEVVEAYNGKEGLEVFSEDPSKYLFIVTDIDMPTMDGFEMVENIRRLPEYGDKVPILMLSTSVSDRELEKSIKIGVNAHEEKFNRTNVMKAITVLLAS